MRTYTKEDVTFHSEGFGRSRPAVNIKVRGYWRDVPLPNPEYDITNPAFSHEWIEENLSEDALADYFWLACESELEYYEGYAQEIFNDPKLKLYTEGRSGGWAVIDGIEDTDEWNAIDLAKWRKFERVGRELADGIPAQMLSLIYINRFEPMLEAKQAAQERSERGAEQK